VRSRAFSRIVVPVGLRFDHEHAAGANDDVVDLRRCTILRREHDVAQNPETGFVQFGDKHNMKQPFAKGAGVPLDECAERKNRRDEETEEDEKRCHGRG